MPTTALKDIARFELGEWRQTGWCKQEEGLRYIERVISVKKIAGEKDAYEVKVKLACSHTNDLVMSYQNANYFIMKQKGVSL